MKRDLSLGLVHGMSIEEYHRDPAISNSGLRDFARSPFHYHALHLNPDRPPEPDRAGQLEGNLAHCVTLEPAHFAQRYAVGPVDDKRLAAWKAWENSVKDGRECIKPLQYEVAQAQALSVRSLPEVAKLLSVGNAEVSAFWIDPATGVRCRCRPDWVYPTSAGVILLDVKTYSTAEPDEFARQVARKAYHRQDAWYSDGYAIAAGVPVLGFVFVAVEMTWPFAACAVMLDDEGIEVGRIENRKLLGRFAECQRTDTWPGYSDGIEMISLPRWAVGSATTNEESRA